MALYNLSSSPFLVSIFSIFFLAILAFTSSDAGLNEDRIIYIVYMGGLPSDTEYSPTSHHESILKDVIGESLVKDVMIHSYKRSFNGFAAKLTEQEVHKLYGRKDIVSLFSSKKLQLHTTRSWDFLGLVETVERVSTTESDIIIGVLDTGIWPESESFKDVGFGPPPTKWKGVCKGGENFTCNNKVIGARYYSQDNSVRDFEGHGTHTASTAAGNIVKDVSFYEIAKGNARGAVSSARIAAYKVCTGLGCASEDILAGFDDAIADGVNLLSVSLGSDSAEEFDEDPIAIGAFHAIQNGILTSHSAGNGGPWRQSVSSNAPWLLTVGATSTDRRIINKVVLGNGKTFEGGAVNGFQLNGTRFPILYGKNVSTKCSFEQARFCYNFCLDKDLVKDKIVICESNDHRGEEALRANALGTIVIEDNEYSDFSFVYALPATLLNTTVGGSVFSYFNSTKQPVGTILKSESIKNSKAPLVASFSSRGPNKILPDIVKPDISAPGIEILAAFSPKGNPSDVPGDKRSVKYSVLSGTSMSCPHVTGAAAYVKSFHPKWSPSAIKSALMTTAFPMNGTKSKESAFDFGAGNINPVKAINPGLVYDLVTDDYVNMLCDIGYSTSKVKLITNHTCPENRAVEGTARDLNYPSFGAKVKDGESIKIKFPRTVTNVGDANSTYKATITSDDRIKVTVEPSVLSFESVNEMKSFALIVEGDGLKKEENATAILYWSDGVHSVRSPIVVYTSS